MIKISIIDDHQLFLKGIGSLLSNSEELEVLECYSRGELFLEDLKKGIIPHVILLDLSMPELSGFEVMDYLKANHPEIKIIILSMHDDSNYIVQSMKQGANGYLLKNSDEEEVKKAISEVYLGKKYFKGEISDKMLNHIINEPATTIKLTKKEVEVLQLIADGKTNSEMADLLFISDRTVETHRANIIKKTDAKNTAELIKKAYQLNLI